jgi:hypothetical protein
MVRRAMLNYSDLSNLLYSIKRGAPEVIVIYDLRSVSILVMSGILFRIFER